MPWAILHLTASDPLPRLEGFPTQEAAWELVRSRFICKTCQTKLRRKPELNIRETPCGRSWDVVTYDPATAPAPEPLPLAPADPNVKYVAIYLPMLAEGAPDPSRRGFATEKEAWAYVESQIGESCREWMAYEWIKEQDIPPHVSESACGCEWFVGTEQGEDEELEEFRSILGQSA